MPYVYVYECSGCRRDVEIVLSREFEVTAAGERIDYRYPDPNLYEWPQRRVSGLWSHLWCPGCRTVRPYVLVELDQPAEHPVQAFLAAEARGLTGRETGPCAECGTGLVLRLDGALCPYCEHGEMVSIGE